MVNLESAKPFALSIRCPPGYFLPRSSGQAARMTLASPSRGPKLAVPPAMDPLMQDSELAKFLVERSYRHARPGEEFKLASGETSTFYWECQFTTLYAPALPLLGAAFLRKFKELGVWPEAVGGPVLGADPITLAIVNTSLDRGPVIQGFRIRKEPKSHGTQRSIENCPAAGTRVVVVDDVVTRGGSVCQAINTCRDEDLNVIACVVLLDREQGGMEKISHAMHGAPSGSIFTQSSLRSLIEQRWPPSR